jgi:aminopeptidase N
VRAVGGAFGANQRAFHHPSGRGYDFVAALVMATDEINPQVSARLVAPLARWRRFEPGRAAMMKQQLERILARPGLSKDVFEQVSKALG